MGEPEEFNLLLSLIGGTIFLFVLACSGLIYFLLGRPKFTKRFPVINPIRDGVVSVALVLMIVLVLAVIRSILNIFS